jgi:hypothetical protein
MLWLRVCFSKLTAGRNRGLTYIGKTRLFHSQVLLPIAGPEASKNNRI